MGKLFQALLIGVPSYEDDAIADMPFIEDDLSELAEALKVTGYDVAIHDAEKTDRESIDLAVESFFARARPGETLLLFLSGHGIHHDGVDCLVPKGAMTWSRHFPGRCLPLDFGRYVEHSPAGDVVVFVDACREGITLREKAVGNVVGWSDMQVRRAGERHYSYVYACSPGERASYIKTGGSGFSLFSRALSIAAADERGPGTLREVRDLLQSTVDDLSAEHSCRQQNVRVSSETDIDNFVIFQRPERISTLPSGEHAWTVLANQHFVWNQVENGPGAQELRAVSCEIVGRLAEQYERGNRLLAADPWRPAGIAERMTDRVSWLLSKVLNPEKLELSPAEGALLVIAPFLYAAFWNQIASTALDVDPENLSRIEAPSKERASYEQFLTSQSRLTRRAARAGDLGDAPGKAGISWWLFHRWLARTSHGHSDDTLAMLIGPAERAIHSNPTATDKWLISEVLNPEPLSRLLRALRNSPDLNNDRPVRQLAGSTEFEQHIRDQLLATLLAVAHGLAIDPTMLPDVVVEHLGISYAVDLSELHKTLVAARWDPRGRTRVLNAACSHPAVGLALKQHATSLDALLGAIDMQSGVGTQLTPLEDLPVHATADRVQAAESAGRPAYESTDLRFRLADDRIQELLMGEQLYGDPALAIRELYQNALDACRYRDARTEFLKRRAAFPGHWSGCIEFTQGEENGRAYIDCKDNGIGMEERELREVFSNAGMRFADLPEYLEERIAWQGEGIDFHPNSRFGIGVLSYFMIADDITVTTCRLDRDGHPGNRLQVDIAGPGALFYIRDLGRGHDAGTTVRLYLRSPDTAPSCMELLRKLLWISDYHVSATDGSARLTWSPRQLSTVAPLGAARASQSPNELRSQDVRVNATESVDVWWCSGMGGVLADGIWVGIPLFGAVVNLTGQYAPVLSVDRRAALYHDSAHVAGLLRQEIPALLKAGATVLGHGWLSDMTAHNAGLADTILASAVEERHPWKVGGRDVDVTIVGCFPQDSWIVDWFLDGIPFDHKRGVVDNLPLPDYIVEWRLRALAKAGQLDGMSVSESFAVPLANPTDSILLTLDSSNATGMAGHNIDASNLGGRVSRDRWLSRNHPVPMGHVLMVANRTGKTPQEIGLRLVELGFCLPEDTVLPDSVQDHDLLWLSQGLNGHQPWLDNVKPVSTGHVLTAAARSGRTPVEVAGRLAELGYFLPQNSVLPSALHPDDHLLLDRNLDAGKPLHVAHVLFAAAKSAQNPSEVAVRLAELDFRLPEGTKVPNALQLHDLLLICQDLDGSVPWIPADQPVHMGHILRAAIRTRLSPKEVAVRLTELGFRLPENTTVPDSFQLHDLLLISRDLNERAPWIPSDQPVHIGHVLSAATRTRIGPREVAARLAELGFPLPENTTVPDSLQPEDLLLVGRGHDGRAPWIPYDRPFLMGDLLGAVLRTELSPKEAASRLAELGFRLPEGTELPATTRRDDFILLSDKVGERMQLGDVVQAARIAGITPRAVIERIRAVGYSFTGVHTLPETLGPHDHLLISSNLDGYAPWLLDGKTVSLSHVLRSAERTGLSPGEAAERLAEMGFGLPENVAVPSTFQPVDLLLLSCNLDGHRPWLPPGRTLPLSHVLRAIKRTGYYPAQVVQRMAELGSTTPAGMLFDRPAVPGESPSEATPG